MARQSLSAGHCRPPCHRIGAAAALRVALCTRIISFGFDESTKFGLSLLSTNTQIEPHDAPGTSVDVLMRGLQEARSPSTVGG